MYHSNILKIFLFSICVTNILAYRRQENKRENSPYNDDLRTDESKDQGFFEDINFKSFFEDVGLKSSPSAPEGVKHRKAAAPQRPKFAYEPSASTDYGFIPADPLFEGSESRSHFTIINSNDDFFAQESNPFEDFYRFDTNPFAASQHHRDYISPYESRRVSNFEDFGPPKGFFNHDFGANFGGGGDSNDKKKNNKNHNAAAETRSEPQYEGEESQAKKDKSKKCETIHKDKMTCEICKDDFGGFSEHCSHNMHSGKDQKYANSQRRSHEDDYNPLKHQGGGQGSGQGGGQGHPANDKASSINTRAYQSPVNQGSYSHPRGSVQNNEGGNNNNNNFGKDQFYNPYAEQSKVSPYNFDHFKAIDELIDTGLKDISSHRQKLVHNLPQKPTRETDEGNKDKKDTIKQASTKEIHQNQHQPQYNQANSNPTQPEYNQATKPQRGPQYHQPKYTPLDAAENFQVLGKMVQKFAKKDRANCKKRVTKKGMTCYVCPNKHGQVDEECMYENTDPKQGVHMMYKEETSY